MHGDNLGEWVSYYRDITSVIPSLSSSLLEAEGYSGLSNCDEDEPSLSSRFASAHLSMHMWVLKEATRTI